MRGYAYAGIAAAIGTGGPVPAMAAVLDPPREVTLRTTISQLDRHADLTDYVVLVQADGGLAEQVMLSVSTRLPARWTNYPQICRPSGRPPGVECPLGDVNGSASVQLVLRLPAALRAAEAIGVVAVAQAANVTVRSVATTEVEYAVPAGQTGTPLDVETPTPAPTHTSYLPWSAPALPDPLPLPGPPLPLQRPTPVPSHERPEPAPKPVQTTPRRPLPAAIPPPPVRRHRQIAPQPMRAAPQVRPPLRLPDPIREYEQPFAAPMPAQAPPQARTPETPPAPTSPVPLLSFPPLPLPSIAPAFPPAPRPGRPAISMLTTTESGTRDHSPWAPVLGIAVASEVALLWVAACLSMWRRKLALSGGHPLPHPARALTRMCRRLRRARLRFHRRS